MSPEAHPATANIRFLEQGAELIRRLDDEAWSAAAPGACRGGVGAQFRHCIDFYRCFLDGLRSGEIDYARRERDARVEAERGQALRRIEALCEELRGLGRDGADRPVRVRAEAEAPGVPSSSASSAARELQFLVSHTIHHYALIAVMLEALGLTVARELPGFGVAPSTLGHWKAIGTIGD